MFGAFHVQTAPENDDPVKWRSKRTASQCLQFLCLSEHLADVWFIFEDSSVRLSAHKFVLTMRSEIFETMFNDHTTDTSEVYITDVGSDVMEHVMRFMYTDYIELDKDNVFSVLYVAKKYVLEGLHEMCILNLIQSIEAKNACEIYERVQGYDLEERVSTACLQYIWHHSWKIFTTESFLKLSRKALVTILQSDDLTGEEISTFRAVMKWAEFQAVSNNVNPTPVILQEFIGDAIYSVRFPLVSIVEFTEEVEPSGVLRTDDLTILRQCLQDKNNHKNVLVEKFNCDQRKGGIMIETIFNAYPHPDLVPGGCEPYYNILFLTTEDIRLHSLAGPLTKDIIAVKMSVHERQGIQYLEPGKDILDIEANWTKVNYNITEHDEIVFVNEPILLPDTYTYVRVELLRSIPGPEQQRNINQAAHAPRGRARRGRRQNRRDLPVAKVTNMSLIIKKTTISLSYIPPGIMQMSFR